MPHKSGKNGTLFMTEDTKRVRQKGDSMGGAGGGVGGTTTARAFLRFLAMSGHDTRHKAKWQENLPSLLAFVLLPLLLLLLQHEEQQQGRHTRCGKQNKTKQSGAE